MYHDMYPIPVTTALCQGLAAALSGLRATVANHIARAWHLEPLLALIYHARPEHRGGPAKPDRGISEVLL